MDNKITDYTRCGICSQCIAITLGEHMNLKNYCK